MKNLSIVLLLLVPSLTIYGQSVDTAGYIYGEIHSSRDSLVGYFKFDHKFDQSGQTVWYKTDLQSSKTKHFQSWRYDYFTSDSVYMELFEVMPYGFGQIKAMVRRVINGPVQLFYFPHSTPFAIVQPKYEPYMIKTANWKKRVSYRKFKKDMLEVLGESSPVYKQIEQETLKYEDLPMIVQLANANADDDAIKAHLAHKAPADTTASQQ